MELEESLIFWEGHFAKLIQHDQFTKQYAYSFRHMYGKEGARKNYTPYSCLKIIMGTPPEAGSHHGCPFRYILTTNIFFFFFYFLIFFFSLPYYLLLDIHPIVI